MVFLRANSERCFFEVEGSDDEFHLYRLSGDEQISALYEFQVEVVSEDSEIALESLVGQAAVVTVQDQTSDEEEQIRFIHGLISAVEIGAQGERLTHYHLTLVPKIWPLTYRHNSRIFQNSTVEEIITVILSEAGLNGDEFRFELSASYPPRDYCVQYRESELNFIQRLMEAEGIHYYFEHEDDRHVLVMSDASTASPPVNGDPLIAYFHDSQGAVREQHIFRFRYRESVVPGRVTLRDYDFKKPRLQLQADNQGEGFAELEVYDYPGSFSDGGQGLQRARVQQQSLARDRQQVRGESDVNRLLPGYHFQLEGHERDSLNRGYLVTAVRHQLRQPQVLEEGAGSEGSQYHNSFICVPHDVPFRPARRTRQPRVQGSQTATVTGPAGEELYTDEFGRVKVQFHWDREGQGDEQSSCWIRVSQPAAGAGFGGFFLPRVGEEVVVDFLEGNPDRPLVIGRVYHGTNRPPYPLPEQKTKSTLKTNSSKGGEGYNELRFEDKKGEEQVFLHAQKDLDQRILNDSREWVGNDRHLVVTRNRTEEVGENQHLKVIGDQVIQVAGNHNHTTDADLLQQTGGTEHYKVGADRIQAVDGDENLKVGGNQNLKVGSNHSLQSGQNIYLKAGMNLVLEAGSTISLKAGGSFVTIGPGGVAIKGAMVDINGGGSALSASTISPAQPAVPDLPEVPHQADSGLAGRVTQVEDQSAPREVTGYSPQAKAMLYASKSGAPFCRQCEAAKQSGEQQG